MITIFTPSYNRAYRLPMLYQSLLRQTSKNFEWIIVDDGSKDNTAELVNGWIEETKQFPIRYYYQDNAGKHVAINNAVKQACYSWFFIVDSDDYLIDNAVEMAHKWIDTVDSHMIAAVSGTKCFPEGRIIGQCGVKPNSFVDAKNNERKKYHLSGDKAEIYRTDILKQFPFPVFSGENFLPEGAVWDRIAIAGYKIRWFAPAITICEYLEDGLTEQIKNSDIELRNFEGCTYSALVGIQAYKGMERIRIVCQYINKARRKGLSILEVSSRLQINRYICMLLLVPVYIKNCIRGRVNESA